MSALHAPLEQLVELLGLPAALALVERFGGVPIYLPHPSRVKADGDLATAIGIEAARKLAAAWPQEHVVVPRAAAYLRRQRDAAIRRDRATMSEREVALKYGTTDRHVRRIQASSSADLDEASGAPRAQGALF